MTIQSAMMANGRRLRIGAVVLVAGFGLAACGSSSSGGTPPTTTPTSQAAAGVPTTAAPPVSTGGGSDTGSSFCKLARTEQAQEAKEVTQFETDNPAQLEAFESQALKALQSFVLVAPSAIKGDVATIAQEDQVLFNALKAAKFNFRNLSPSVESSLNKPAFTKATQAIVAYLASACGIHSSPAPTG